MIEIESEILCPECGRERITVMLRSLSDGSGQCWGECGCGSRVRGGALRRPIPFDAEALVAIQAARVREGSR